MNSSGRHLRVFDCEITFCPDASVCITIISVCCRSIHDATIDSQVAIGPDSGDNCTTNIILVTTICNCQFTGAIRLSIDIKIMSAARI